MTAAVAALAWAPFWLDHGGRRRYAALHRDAALPARAGVVIAPPLLHEQPRSRRVLLDAAARIAALGVPALRFDYYGSGDSDGRGEQHDLAQMHEDLSAATARLRAETGVARVAVLAWRAGALAAWSWARAREDLAALALWEPVPDGAAWLRSLEDADRAERRLRYGEAHAAPDDGCLMGYPTSAAWRDEIASVAIDAAPPAPLWLIGRAGAAPLPFDAARRFALPDDAPRFDGAGVGVEAASFLSRGTRAVIDDLARAFAALDG